MCLVSAVVLKRTEEMSYGLLVSPMCQVAVTKELQNAVVRPVVHWINCLWNGVGFVLAFRYSVGDHVHCFKCNDGKRSCCDSSLKHVRGLATITRHRFHLVQKYSFVLMHSGGKACGSSLRPFRRKRLLVAQSPDKHCLVAQSPDKQLRFINGTRCCC